MLVRVRKHLLTAIITFAVIVGTMAVYTFTRTPMYTATAQMYASYQGLTSENGAADLSSINMGTTYINSQLDTYPNLVKTEAVLKPVIDELGLNMTVGQLGSMVSASRPDSTYMIDISASSSDPKMASSVVNKVAESLKTQVSSGLTADNRKAVSPVNLSVVQPAYTPVAPSSPNKTLNMLVAVFLGLIVGFTLALLRDLMDKNVRQVADIEYITETSVIGTLPNNAVFAGKSPVVIAQPSGHAAEEIRRLRANLMFISPDASGNTNVVIVASSSADEGKTTVATNLAAAYAENGSSVLLIDADMRNPSVAKKLGISGSVGLAHLLTGQVDSKEAIQRYWKPNFHVLPAGDKVPNPSVLLNSNAMHELIAQVAQHYDRVIIDTSPMKVAGDAAVFARDGGEVLLVVGNNVARKTDLKQTVQEFKTIDVPLVGSVFNFAPIDKKSNGEYYYYYGEDKNGKPEGASDGKESKAKHK